MPFTAFKKLQSVFGRWLAPAKPPEPQASAMRPPTVLSYRQFQQEPQALSVAYSLAAVTPASFFAPLAEALAQQESVQRVPIHMIGSGEAGIAAKFEGATWRLGRADYLQQAGVLWPESIQTSSVNQVFLSRQGVLVGAFDFTA